MRRLALSAMIVAGSLALGCSSTAAPDTNAAEDDVVTKRCPASLNASFGSLDAYSFAEIEQRTGFELSTSDKDELRSPIKRIEADLYRYDAQLVLDKAAKAVCTYRPASPDSPKVTAKFYTSSGKNVLRVDAADGAARDLSFYVTVKSYTKDSITLATGNAAIIFRAPDSEATFRPVDVGRAGEASVSAGPVGPAVPVTDDALETALKEAVAGVTFTSEADADFDVFRAPLAPNEKVDAATVKAKFNGMPNTEDDGVALKDLVGQDEGKFAEWFAGDLVDEEGADEDTQKYTAAMRAVHVLMTSSLTDLKVVYVANSSLEHTHDVGWVQIFVVGRSPSGTLFAIHTGAAWT